MTMRIIFLAVDFASYTGLHPFSAIHIIFSVSYSRNQMRRQDVSEKKMPYNNSVKPVEVTEKTTAQ